MIRCEDEKGDIVTFHPTMAVLDFSAGKLAYDVKGNQTSRPATLSAPALNLDWNFDNQLRGADTNGSAGSLEVTFEYDALGRRVSRSHSSGNVVYVHAGQQVIADYARGAVTSSPTYRYVYADCLGYEGYVDEPILRHTGTTTTLPTTGDNALYYHRNQQYSIVGLTNAAGTLVERYSYSAYGTLGIYAANGTVRSSSTYANRYTYTGREWDGDLRLYHFRARWYDPATGGFVTRDPLGYVDGMSLYRGYFGVSESDPTGKRRYSFGWDVKQMPKPDTPCGEASAKMQWHIVDIPDGGEATGLYGYIVQKVELDIEHTTCDAEGSHGRDHLCYYEAWEVRDGVIYVWGNKRHHPNGVDLFKIGNLPEKSFGSGTITGEVAFLKDYILTAPPWAYWHTPKKRNPLHNHVATAQRLPTLQCESGTPEGWENAQKFRRKLASIWDCCCDPIKETDVSGSEGWSLGIQLAAPVPY